MSEEFPFPCCRCGYCCLSETCQAGQMVYGVGKYDPCPGLFFHFDTAICQIALEYPDHPEIIGIGCGCCIKARAIKGGVTYDFAALPPAFKHSIVKTTLQRRSAQCLVITVA